MFAIYMSVTMPVEKWVLTPETLNEGAMLCIKAKFATD